MNFDDMIVMVTGAAGGIGKATCLRFLDAGAYVYAVDLVKPSWVCSVNNLQSLEQISLDVTDEKGLIKFVAGKGINVLVNNAGVAYECPIQDLELSDWRRIMDVNATGTVLCTREVVSSLLANNSEGRIISISSIAGKNAFALNAAYAASKAAVIGMSRSLAVELAPKGITVNVICPGSVDTPMLHRVIKNVAEKSGDSYEATRDSFESSVPTRRFQDPDEVAALCVFLASHDARSINGESINLDGGVVRD